MFSMVISSISVVISVDFRESGYQGSLGGSVAAW